MKKEGLLFRAAPFFSFFTFFLDKKSNKKVKANAIAPQALPGQRTVRLRLFGESLLFRSEQRKTPLHDTVSSWRRWLFRLAALLLPVTFVKPKKRRWKISLVQRRKALVCYANEMSLVVTFSLSLLFVLIQKVTKRSRTKEWLRPFVRLRLFFHLGLVLLQ